MRYNHEMTLKRGAGSVKHSVNDNVKRYVRIGLLLFLGSMQGSMLHAGDGFKAEIPLKNQTDSRKTGLFSSEIKNTETTSPSKTIETDDSYQSLFVRVGLGSWSEKVKGNSRSLSSSIFLRGDYAYMWDWIPGLGGGIFYVYSSNNFNAKYWAENYIYSTLKKADCDVRVHYLGPQMLYRTDRKRFSLKFSAGVGGALYAGLLSQESTHEENYSKPSHDKYGWVYSLSGGVEMKLTRHVSMSMEYNFMNSFFSYKGYGKIPDGTAKLYHHIAWFGVGYYF